MYEETKDLRIFQAVEDLADKIWNEVSKWDSFAKFTIGKQLVDAIDSVGSNMEESDGRYHYKDKLNFLYFARGSLKEARRWIIRAMRRKLFSSEVIGKKFLDEVENLLPQYNSYITIKKRKWTKTEKGI